MNLETFLDPNLLFEKLIRRWFFATVLISFYTFRQVFILYANGKLVCTYLANSSKWDRGFSTFRLTVSTF